jgi:Cu/Ag efflux pump CusA
MDKLVQPVAQWIVLAMVTSLLVAMVVVPALHAVFSRGWIHQDLTQGQHKRIRMIDIVWDHNIYVLIVI